MRQAKQTPHQARVHVQMEEEERMRNGETQGGNVSDKQRGNRKESERSGNIIVIQPTFMTSI